MAAAAAKASSALGAWQHPCPAVNCGQPMESWLQRELSRARAMRYVARAKLKIKHILCPRPHLFSPHQPKDVKVTHQLTRNTPYPHPYTSFSSRQCRRHALSSKLLVQPPQPGCISPTAHGIFNLFDDTNPPSTACSTRCAHSSHSIGNRPACAREKKIYPSIVPC